MHKPQPRLAVVCCAALIIAFTGCGPRNANAELDAEIGKAKERMRAVTDAAERRCREATDKQLAANEEQAKKIFDRLAEIAKQLATAEESLKSQPEKEELAKLRKELDELSRDVRIDRYVRDFRNIAYLTPGDQGYSSISCDLGTLTVSIQDVSAYANGARVSLDFGNPLSTDLTGVSATVEYGTVDEKGSPKNEDQKTKEVSFNDDMVGGSFTPMTMVLDGVPPEKLGFVRIKNLKHKGVSLRRPK
jgi:hypothetical protein